MPDEILRAVGFEELRRISKTLKELEQDVHMMHIHSRPLKPEGVEADAATMLSDFVYRHVAAANNQYGLDWRWDYELDTPLPLARIRSPKRMTDFVIHRGIQSGTHFEAYPDTCNLVNIFKREGEDPCRIYTVDICHYTSASPAFTELLRTCT